MFLFNTQIKFYLKVSKNWNLQIMWEMLTFQRIKVLDFALKKNLVGDADWACFPAGGALNQLMWNRGLNDLLETPAKH